MGHRIWVLVAAALIAIAAFAPREARAADTISFGHPGAPTGILWPLYIGIDQGFYAAENITIDLIFVHSSASVVQQVAAGSLDLGDTGTLDPVRAIDQGADIAILCIQAAPSPYGLVAKPAITDIHALKGRLIAVGDTTDIARDYLDGILVGNGMADSDIDPLPSTSTAARLAALEIGGGRGRRAVGAGLVSRAIRWICPARPRQRLRERLSLRGDFGQSLLGAGSSRYRQTVSCRATQERRLALRREERDAAVAIMAKASKDKPDDVAKSLDFYNRIGFFERDVAIPKAGMEAAIAMLQRRGDIKDQLPAEKLIMPSLTQFRE